jgi:hypothetical protein
MDKLLQVVVERQTKIMDDIVDMKVLLAKQEENLAYHVKRTDLAEENIKLLRAQLEKDLAPVKSHVALVNAALKIVGGLSVALSITVSVVKLISYLT